MDTCEEIKCAEMILLKKSSNEDLEVTSESHAKVNGNPELDSDAENGCGSGKGTSNAVNPNKILPIVVWGRVLDYLMTPEDVWRIGISFPFLAHHFHEHMNAARLFLVLDVVTTRGYLHEPEDNQASPYPNHAVPHLRKLRHVCKIWRRIVDQHFYKYAEMLDWSDSKYLVSKWAYGLLMFYETQESMAHQVMNHFRETHQTTGVNPFVIPYIRLQNRQLGPWNPTLLEMLFIYGCHMKRLYLFLGTPPELTEVGVPMYCCMVEVINLTQNITSLQLTLRDSKLDKIDFNQLEFPHLPRLRTFSAFHLATPIINLILQTNKQIRELKIAGPLNTIQLNTPVLLSLKNLSKLELEMWPVLDNPVLVLLPEPEHGWPLDGPQLKHIQPEIIPNWWDHPLLLLDVPEVNWPLEELNLLQLHLDLPGTNKLFDMLSRKWGHTLKTLRLIDWEGPNGPVSLPPLSLDQLEKLRLHTMEMCYNLDFLLPCRQSLKMLDITMFAKKGMAECQRLKDSEKTIQFWKCVESPFESNVWNVFPALERFECELYMYPNRFSVKNWRWTHTRNQWRECRKNQKERAGIKPVKEEEENEPRKKKRQNQ